MAEGTDNAAGTGTGAQAGAGGVPSLAGTSPRRYRRRLANLRNVRTALADVVQGLEDGTMEPGTARAIVYALATLAGVIRDEGMSDLERRLASLEAAARGTTP